jgi:hypothetical protein
MTSIFLHGREFSDPLRAFRALRLVDERGELALLPPAVAPTVFGDRVLGATRGREDVRF